MKYKKENKKAYESPRILDLINLKPSNTFASMSAYGDVYDFEEGGEFDAYFVDTL